jgi:hypothetical protein
MDHEPLQLFWKDHFIGTITQVGWSDFPWAGGKLAIEALDPDMRKVLEYVSTEAASEDGLHDWPFEDEYWNNWSVIKPNGIRIEICLPVIDFSDGYIEWR